MPLTHYLRLIPRSLLLLLLCSSPISCFGNPWDDCRSPHGCGKFNYSYPFGLIGTGCGYPDFQLRCVSDDYLMLQIGGEQYHILKASFLANNSESHLISIVKDSLFWDKCSSPGNYTQPLLYGPSFDMASEYTNLTFWRECDPSFKTGMVEFSGCDDWLYSFDPVRDSNGTRFCETHFQLPIKKDDDPQLSPTFLTDGFEILWHVDPSRNLRCGPCEKSNGSCGYNPWDSTSFLCYCPDGTSHPDKCLADGRLPDPSRNLRCGPCDKSNGSCGYDPPDSTSFVCYCPDGTSHPDKCLADGSRNQKAIIIGCSIGGVVLTAAVVILFLKFYGKRRKQPPPPPRSSTSKVEKFLREYAYEMPTRYSYSQLKKITNNFAEKLGEGGFGVVYKGKLRNGALVAVKLLDRHRHSQTQFMNEVATIGRVHHVNLVRLLGYCFESPTSALVYEYMVNGSLEKFIFARKENGQVLRWEQLYSIALGTARGIAYLHQDCEKRIIHFDIKPHNILLDVEFTPKVSDFGLATLCGKGDDHVSMTAARGTPGYVAPEVWNRDLGPVTDRADVYSFGMLLLEVVGGRKNIGVQVSRSSQFYFPEWAFKLLESGELGMRLRGGEMEVEEEEKARRLTKVGLWCIQYIYRDRPCMSRVVQMLEGNGDDVSSPPLPFNSSPEPEKPLPSSSSIEIRL